MYTTFSLKLSGFRESPSVTEYKTKGNTIAVLQGIKLDKLLPQYTDNGIIDGTGLADEWFKDIQTDVFISYSHNDLELAQIIAGFLEKELGLKVFLDGYFWGSADSLIEKLDEKHSRNDNGSFNYNKCLLTSSHIHSMLSVAIMKVMDKAEMVLFLNTKESIPAAKDTISKTYSPWIYEELMFTQLLKRKIPKRFLKIDETFSYREDDLKVAYRVPVDSLKVLTWEQITEWNRKAAAAKKNGTAALDVLYDMVLPRREKH